MAHPPKGTQYPLNYIPSGSLPPQVMPEKKLGICVLLMGSCFLGEAMLLWFFKILPPPLQWPECPVSLHICRITTFLQQKQSLFSNELSPHLLESALPNHPQWCAPLKTSQGLQSISASRLPEMAGHQPEMKQMLLSTVGLTKEWVYNIQTRTNCRGCLFETFSRITPTDLACLIRMT